MISRWKRIVAAFTAVAETTQRQVPTPQTHKVCKRCGESKLREEFYKRYEGINQKVTAECKPCYALASKERQERSKRRKHVQLPEPIVWTC